MIPESFESNFPILNEKGKPTLVNTCCWAGCLTLTMDETVGSNS